MKKWMIIGAVVFGLGVFGSLLPETAEAPRTTQGTEETQAPETQGPSPEHVADCQRRAEAGVEASGLLAEMSKSAETEADFRQVIKSGRGMVSATRQFIADCGDVADMAEVETSTDEVEKALDTAEAQLG